jgi:hypothetical protein
LLGGEDLPHSQHGFQAALREALAQLLDDLVLAANLGGTAIPRHQGTELFCGFFEGLPILNQPAVFQVFSPESSQLLPLLWGQIQALDPF